MDLNFDVPVEEFPDPAEYSNFVQGEKVNLANAETERVIPNLIESLATEPPGVWLPLLMLHRDDNARTQHVGTFYSKQFVEETLVNFVPDAIYAKKFDKLEVRLLGAAVATAVSNITYSNDGGKAHMAMQAKAMCKNGRWVITAPPPNKHVIAITSQHAVDLQLFCCSVDIGSESRFENVGKRPRIFKTPKFVEKNVNQKEQLPVEVKRLFIGLLKFPEKAKVTAAAIEAAPFLWKSIYHTIKEIEIPIDSIPMPLAFFTWCNKTFGYTPKSCPLNNVLYASYPPVLKELSHTVATHSVLVGGIFVKARHFENEAIKHSKCKHIGGEFATELCYYNTNYGVTWEAAGAAIEHPRSGLDTTINSIRPFAQFDGVWWNPRNKPVMYEKAKGFVLPYDRNGHGLKWIKEFAALPQHAGKYWRIWCHFGAMPALWCEMMDATDPYAALFNPYGADMLWKVMGVMGIYNMQASLNRNYALALAKGVISEQQELLKAWATKGVPVDPIFCLILNGFNSTSYTYLRTRSGQAIQETIEVPAVIVDGIPLEWLPGRWMISSNEFDQNEDLKQGFAHFNAYAEFMRKASGGFTDAPGRNTGSHNHEPVENAFFDANVYGPPPKKKKPEEEAGVEMDV